MTKLQRTVLYVGIASLGAWTSIDISVEEMVTGGAIIVLLTAIGVWHFRDEGGGDLMDIPSENKKTWPPVQ